MKDPAFYASEKFITIKIFPEAFSLFIDAFFVDSEGSKVKFYFLPVHQSNDKYLVNLYVLLNPVTFAKKLEYINESLELPVIDKAFHVFQYVYSMLSFSVDLNSDEPIEIAFDVDSWLLQEARSIHKDISLSVFHAASAIQSVSQEHIEVETSFAVEEFLDSFEI